MLRVDETGEEFEILNVLPCFTIESADLLKKGLTARNDKLRAWSVWQLRRVGYKFSQEELDKLLKDDSWMVRANAVMAEPQRAKNIVMNDKNGFVRFVATLSPDSP
jgi:HEAT repeat protein